MAAPLPRKNRDSSSEEEEEQRFMRLLYEEVWGVVVRCTVYGRDVCRGCMVYGVGCTI